MSHSRRSARTRSGERSESIPIFSSPNPSRFAIHRSSGVSVSSISRSSIRAIRWKARVNHGSIPVARDNSSGETSRRRAAISAHSRSSFGPIGKRSDSPSSDLSHPESSHSSERFVISSDLTAFWNAASKERSIAITSPVAFICVPMLRSPRGNLSNGQRGIFTTQ